jgi:hypothetical protein
MVGPGLRERKKERTRRHIADTAAPRVVSASYRLRVCQGTDGRVSVQLTIRRRSANSHTPSCLTNVSR